METFLQCQIKSLKTSCKGGLKRDASITKKGQKLSVDELELNLRHVTSEIMVGQSDEGAIKFIRDAMFHRREGGEKKCFEITP